jgi:hypothetical protein
MPIGVQQFQPEPIEATGWGNAIRGLQQGINSGQGIYSNYQKNKYLAPTLKAELEGKQLDNKYIPLKTMMEAERVKQQAAQIAQSQNRFGLFYQLKNFYNTPVGAQLLKDNPDLAAAYARIAAGNSNAADDQVLAKNAGVNPNQDQNTLSPQLMQEYNNLFPPQQQQPQQAQPQQGQPQQSPQPMQRPVQPPMSEDQKNQAFGITPEMVRNIRDTSGSFAIKKTTPNQVQLQRYYDESVDNMIKQADPMIDKIANFAGVSGKFKRGLGSLEANLGLRTSKDYQDYLQFAEITSQFIANEVGRSLGNNATDNQKEWMKQLSNPAVIAGNPQLAKQLWSALKASLKQNERAIAKTPNQVNDSLNARVNSPSGKVASDGRDHSEISDEELDAIIARGGK